MSSASNHIERVLSAAQSNSAAARSRLAASWRRSALTHGVDPGGNHRPERHDNREIGYRRDALEDVLRIAGPHLDRLFNLVDMSGCAVFLTDAEGVILDQRTTEADASVFRSWNLWSGADWSEAREGTNGIGTCLAENRRLIIDRDEHFCARNTAMSCIDAPIYGSDGKLVAALDVSSARADQTQLINRLIAAQVSQTARAIEEANFRAAYGKARIVVADHEDADAAVLLAIDDDDLVVGATREARRVFGLGGETRFAPRPAADILGRDEGPGGFERAERAAVVRALARAGGNVSKAARSLGIGRATLYRRMNRLGLEEDRSKLSQD